MSEHNETLFDGIEIPDNLLEDVAGGELSERDMAGLHRLMQMGKLSGWKTADNVVNYLRAQYDRPEFAVMGTYLAEATEYVRKHWDEI